MSKPPSLPRVTYEILDALDMDAERDFFDFCISEDEIGELKEAIKEGLIRVLAINENDERIGTLFYAIAEESAKFIVLGITAKSNEVFGLLRRMTWFKGFVRGCGCTRVVAETRRSGVFRNLLDIGFKPVSVEMEWDLI